MYVADQIDKIHISNEVSNMLVSIRNSYDTFTATEKRIADYILINPRIVMSMSIQELAEKTQVSPPSISRFVRKITGKSFFEMKITLAQNINEKEVDSLDDVVAWADDAREITQKTINNISLICNDVLKINDLTDFEKAIEILLGAENVFLYGVGNSSLNASNLQQKLMRVGKRCIYNIDSDFGILNSMNCNEKDVVVAISFSGRTKEILVAAKESKEHGAKLIAITSYSDNPLTVYADVVLRVPTLEINESKISAIFSRYGESFIIDVLYIGLVKRLADTLFEDKQNAYRKLLGQLKE